MFKSEQTTRVLEIGNYAAGYAGKLFAHAGCDVVRIEPEKRKACWVSERAMDLFLHHDKRRVATFDHDLIANFANKADVALVDGESADEITRLGFESWETPIKVSITPFGLTGPDRNRAATNATILALGRVHQSDGRPGTRPIVLTWPLRGFPKWRIRVYGSERVPSR